MAAVDPIAEALEARGLTVAVAESLTAGMLASTLARGPGASAWFRGGVVAYHPDVKRELLGIGGAHVVSDDAVRAMAGGVARLLGADLGVATTGVGGPDPQDGIPPGTVLIAVAGSDGVRVARHRFEGDPGSVLESTCAAATDLLDEALRALDR